MAQLVARFVRDEEAFGSSPNTPTRQKTAGCIFLRFYFVKTKMMTSLFYSGVLTVPMNGQHSKHHGERHCCRKSFSYHLFSSHIIRLRLSVKCDMITHSRIDCGILILAFCQYNNTSFYCISIRFDFFCCGHYNKNLLKNIKRTFLWKLR